MKHPGLLRQRLVARIRHALERLHAPRLQMMFIVALTGACGFLASFLLLHAGLTALWLRYPLAVAIAYMAFLFFLWCWLRGHAPDNFDLPLGERPTTGGGGASAEPPASWGGAGGDFGGGGASGSFDDVPQVASNAYRSNTPEANSIADEAASVFEADEWALVLIALAALFGALWAAVWIVWVAPALLAELVLDAALAAGLYRHMRGISSEHWLRTALRRTGWQFAGVALCFALAGGLMQLYAPGAKSIGQVLERSENSHR